MTWKFRVWVSWDVWFELCHDFPSTFTPCMTWIFPFDPQNAGLIPCNLCSFTFFFPKKKSFCFAASSFCKFIQMNGKWGFETFKDCLFFPHTNLMISIILHRITRTSTHCKLRIQAPSILNLIVIENSLISLLLFFEFLLLWNLIIYFALFCLKISIQPTFAVVLNLLIFHLKFPKHFAKLFKQSKKFEKRAKFSYKKATSPATSALQFKYT